MFPPPQMTAYEFIQLVSGSDVNYKQQRRRHPSLKGPIPKAPPHICIALPGIVSPLKAS